MWCRHGCHPGAERGRGLARGSVAWSPASGVLIGDIMKKPTFKKLGLSAETIRNLTVMELGGVAGGLDTIIVTTTKSITSACIPPLTTSGVIDTGAGNPG